MSGATTACQTLTRLFAIPTTTPSLVRTRCDSRSPKARNSARSLRLAGETSYEEVESHSRLLENFMFTKMMPSYTLLVAANTSVTIYHRSHVSP